MSSTKAIIGTNSGQASAPQTLPKRVRKRRPTTITSRARRASNTMIAMKSLQQARFATSEFLLMIKSNTSAQKKRRSTAARALPPKDVFPFILLPSEIKNMIFEYALLSKREILLASKTKKYRHNVEIKRTADCIWVPDPTNSHIPVKHLCLCRPSFTPNVILLNREIYAQTQPILYSNTFAFEDPKALLAFCINIGPKNCVLLQRLSLWHWDCTRAKRTLRYPAFAILANTTLNLKSLDVDRGYCGEDERRLAVHFLRDCHTWLEAVGLKGGRPDAGVEILQLSKEHVAGSAASGTDQEKLEKMTEAFRAEIRKLLKA